MFHGFREMIRCILKVWKTIPNTSLTNIESDYRMVNLTSLRNIENDYWMVSLISLTNVESDYWIVFLTSRYNNTHPPKNDLSAVKFKQDSPPIKVAFFRGGTFFFDIFMNELVINADGFLKTTNTRYYGSFLAFRLFKLYAHILLLNIDLTQIWNSEIIIEGLLHKHHILGFNIVCIDVIVPHRVVEILLLRISTVYRFVKLYLWIIIAH